jgi:hypothetical protein
MIINEELVKEKWPFNQRAWPERTFMVTELIPPEASIIELGAGLCFLHHILPGNPYVGVDIEAWTDKIIKADFNADEFPELGPFDAIVCQGIMEYIRDPEKFLLAIHKYGRLLILSYYNGPYCDDRKNKMKFAWLLDLLERTGWVVIRTCELSLHQRVYSLIQKP